MREMVRLGDVCIVERGGSPRPIEKYITDSEDGVNWIKIGDTSDSMFITKTAQKITRNGMKKSRYVVPGDFLLSNSMSFGRPYILKIDGCIHDGWLVLRDKDNLFDKHFLYYQLSAPTTYQKFKSMAVGGVVNNLNSEMVRGIDVLLPPLPEQRHIAAVLDKVSELIALRKRQLDLLDEMVKARFVEMFGTICESEYKVLIDVCTLITDGTHNPPDFVDKGIPFLLVSNIRENRITYDTHKFITEETYNQLIKRTPIEKGDVLLSTVGSYGHPAIVNSDKKFSFQRHIAQLKPNHKIINSVFLHSAILSPSAQRQINSLVLGVAQKTLNLSVVKTIKIPVPSISKQTQFADFVQQVEKSKAAVQQGLDRLNLLKSALMQEYFG